MPLYVSLLYVCAERTGVRDPPVGLAIAPPTLSPSHLPPAKELSPPCSALRTPHSERGTRHTALGMRSIQSPLLPVLGPLGPHVPL